MAETKNIPIYLPRNEWKLIAALLKMAHDDFHEHGCNDLDAELIELLPHERWQEMAAENTGRDDEDPNVAQRDDFLMDYYGQLIDEATPPSGRGVRDE